MLEPVVLAARLAGREILVVALGAEHAARGASDRVLVERLAACVDPREPEGEERRERAAQLVLLRQLLRVQPRELGGLRQESRLGAEHQ